MFKLEDSCGATFKRRTTRIAGIVNLQSTKAGNFTFRDKQSASIFTTPFTSIRSS